ncbi:LLM class F420-dependent oxidoreductase [Streptomyces sp. DSM 44917]|uniref:LLM class F420-dependent oxidoreductase n=1 Tax=Streptomyces boetiae TaxID=3075541 RepID=A0ABU2LCI2_9ACTN|nr:LLM class F420-dependent oxidoreductase [Streptomyces sp. DSM 44917]MDT0309290.1 LLM class F420-dependent oxidoreductase [Streptomyces sp. DSM 44917]
MGNAETTALGRDLGAYGVWTGVLLSQDAERVALLPGVGRELEKLGYGTLWLGGGPGVDRAEPVLAATSRLTVATGILSIWDWEPAEVAGEYHRVQAAHGGRFVLGLGVSHAALTERYRRPYSAMREFLDGLDAAPQPVPAERRVLAALGPRMVELSRDRAGGAHPYLVTVEHTAHTRAALGPGAVLAPELKVVLDEDEERARATARNYLSFYLALPNYTNNLRRYGFGDEDFADGGSDRLVDAVFALGNAASVAGRARAFREAGADHVAFQVVTQEPLRDLPVEAYADLARALDLTGTGD